MEAIRKIIHVDMDAFYASVEQRDRPELRGRPVVVGGSPEGRGVVASASYEARRYGVRSAMSARQALQRCPGIVFVRPDFYKYKMASQKIREIFYEVTPIVEPLSLDEAYLDVTSNKLNEPFATKLAVLIRKRIRDELGLTASAGVAPNKFLAKLASDMQKPDGLVVIPPEKVATVVAKLPVEKLWGVGPATAKKLNEWGFITTEDLRQCPSGILQARLGKFGLFIHRLAHGEDDRPVHHHRELKSRGSETTFSSDVIDLDKLVATLRELAEDLAQGLSRGELRGHTVTLKVRYHDFKTITRSRTVPDAISEARAIAEIGEALLRTGTEAGKRPVRLIGVSLKHFAKAETSQLPEQLALAID